MTPRTVLKNLAAHPDAVVRCENGQVTAEIQPAKLIRAIATNGHGQMTRLAASMLIEVGVFPDMPMRELVADIRELWDLGVLEPFFQPERPDSQSERNGREAGERARAATDRAIAKIPAKRGRLWQTYHLVYEHLLSYGRWRDTFTVRGLAERVADEESAGWRRDRMAEDIREIADLGVWWYWPATGRGAGKYAMVELPPVADSQRPADTGGRSVTEATERPASTARSTSTYRANDQHTYGHSIETTKETYPEAGEISKNASERDSSADASTPEDGEPSATKETDDDVAGFFAVIRDYIGIKLEPNRTLVDEIKSAIERTGHGGRHIAGALEPKTWPATFKESPEAFAVYKLRNLR